MTVKDPCSSCQHRADSTACVERYLIRNPEGVGPVCGPAQNVSASSITGMERKTPPG
jgi:hypothetical protein